MKKRSIGLSYILFYIAGILLILAGATFALQRLSRRAVAGDEFPVNYLAAKNWLNQNRSPYDLSNGDQVLSVVNKTNGSDKETALSYFRYPLLSTIIVMPFTFLPADTAKALWMAINCFVLILSCLLLSNTLWQKIKMSYLAVIAIFGALNYYSLYTILTGSLIPFVFMAFVVTIFLLINHKDNIAGFVLTISLVEFQIVFFFIIFILIWAATNKRNGFIRSFWAGLIFELIISLILLPTWPAGWLRSLMLDINIDGIYSSILSQFIHSQYPGYLWLNIGIHLGLLLCMVLLWMRYRSGDGQSLLWVTCLTFIISSLIVFSSTPGLMIFSIPALLMVISVWMRRLERHGNLFFWIAMGLLLISPWAITLIEKQTVPAGINLMLIIFFPIIGIIGLWWIRWWILKPDLSLKTIP